MVVVFYAFNCVVNVGGVGLLGRIDLRRRSLRDTVPAETDWLTFVQQRRMVLILIHHLMEAENGGQIDNLLLGGVGESLLVFVTHVDGDLFLCLLHSLALRRWNPFLASDRSLHIWLQIGNIGCFDRLLVDVLNQFLAVEWPCR